MNMVGILGSPNPRGRTARAAEALLMGAGGEGVLWDLLVLPEREVGRCQQCDEDGWGRCKRAGLCVLEDQFAEVVDRIRQADAVVFATPVYYSDLSESFKALLDRLRRICSHPEARRDRIAGKPVIGVCVAGGGGGGAPRCTVALEQVLQDCGFDVVDMVPVRRQNLTIKRTVLKATGRWLAGELRGSAAR